MPRKAATELNAEQRREVAPWIAASRDGLPKSVQIFLGIHEPYLAAGEGDPLRRGLEAAVRELRRALHLTPSSEKRRTSGSPLAGLPGEDVLPAMSERERLEAQAARSDQPADWHRGLEKRHDERAERAKKRLATMPKAKLDAVPESDEIPSLEEIELTEEQKAEGKAAGKRFVAHLSEGNGADPALRSTTETLMPGNAVAVEEGQAFAVHGLTR